MRTRVGIGALGFAALLSISTPGAQPVAWKCQARPVEACAKRHGRLSSQNGIALKIWIIGTTRVLGLENDFEDLPEQVRKYLYMTSENHSYIFGDFDVCPVEPDTPGRSRRVCVAGAQNLVVQPLRRSAPSFRLRSTWPARDGRQEGASPKAR